MKLMYKEESFKPNYNDSIVSRIEEKFENIYNRFEAEFLSPTHTSTYDMVKPELDAIEKLVKERFGFGVEIKNSKTFLATRVPAPKTISGVRNYRKIYKEVSEAIEKGKGNVNELKKFISQSNKLDEFLHLNAIKVDLNKLRIDNLLDSFKPTIYINFKRICNKNSGISFKELTAGFLHEVGHIFTFIAYSYRCRLKRLSFEEAIMDKSKLGKENSFLLAYEEAFQDDRFRGKDIRNPVVFLDVSKNIVEHVSSELYVSNSTDKEYMADAFAAALGYGKYLSSFITKIEIQHGTALRDGLIAVVVGTTIWACIWIMLYLIIFMLLLAPAIFLPVVAFFCSVMIGYVIAAVISVMGIMLLTPNHSVSEEYGTAIERLERIRRDCVNNLNKLVNEGAEQEVIDMVLEEIESIKEDKKALKEKQGTSYVSEIVDYFMGWSSSYKNSKEVTTLKDSIEALLYNDLHVSKEILKGALK